MATPTEIRLDRAARMLRVSFNDGAVFDLPFEYLRVESPSAEVQGHGPGEKRLVVDTRDVGVTRVEPVGNYAVLLVFHDGHDTGIFSWDYLYELGQQRPGRWQAYLDALAALGLSR